MLTLHISQIFMVVFSLIAPSRFCSWPILNEIERTPLHAVSFRWIPRPLKSPKDGAETLSLVGTRYDTVYILYCCETWVLDTSVISVAHIATPFHPCQPKGSVELDTQNAFGSIRIWPVLTWRAMFFSVMSHAVKFRIDKTLSVVVESRHAFHIFISGKIKMRVEIECDGQVSL